MKDFFKIILFLCLASGAAYGFYKLIQRPPIDQGVCDWTNGPALYTHVWYENHIIYSTFVPFAKLTDSSKIIEYRRADSVLKMVEQFSK
jgi:hypothetical protein